jgi:hypothetical protein
MITMRAGNLSCLPGGFADSAEFVQAQWGEGKLCLQVGDGSRMSQKLAQLVLQFSSFPNQKRGNKKREIKREKVTVPAV